MTFNLYTVVVGKQRGLKVSFARFLIRLTGLVPCRIQIRPSMKKFESTANKIEVVGETSAWLSSSRGQNLPSDSIFADDDRR